MRRLTSAVSALALALTLAACSSGDGDGETTPNGSASATQQDTQGSGDTDDQGEPGDEMPTLDTSGDNPVLAFPESNPPEGMQVEVVEEGDGRVVEETDYVVAHYEGQVWGNPDPFDSSFERGSPTGFSLQQVIAGWTQGLSGQKIGSKVILSIPSELGYAEGNPGAGIAPGDTIAFYVEIHDAFGMDQAGDANAEVTIDEGELPVEIDGELGEPITIALKDGADAPEDLSMEVIAEGSGETVGGAGTTVYVQYAAAFWDSDIAEATYGTVGPQAPVIGSGSLFDELEGVPVGSRLLILVPAAEGGDGGNANNAPAFAAVVDVLGQMASDNANPDDATPSEDVSATDDEPSGDDPTSSEETSE